MWNFVIFFTCSTKAAIATPLPAMRRRVIFKVEHTVFALEVVYLRFSLLGRDHLRQEGEAD